jgi:hypothetical protein
MRFSLQLELYSGRQISITGNLARFGDVRGAFEAVRRERIARPATGKPTAQSGQGALIYEPADVTEANIPNDENKKTA